MLKYGLYMCQKTLTAKGKEGLHQKLKVFKSLEMTHFGCLGAMELYLCASISFRQFLSEIHIFQFFEIYKSWLCCIFLCTLSMTVNK